MSKNKMSPLQRAYGRGYTAGKNRSKKTHAKHEVNYRYARDAAQEACDDSVRAFARWFAVEWQQTRQSWEKATADPVPSDDWFAGYNAGVESALTAVDMFLGDL